MDVDGLKKNTLFNFCKTKFLIFLAGKIVCVDQNLFSGNGTNCAY
jgi:hypothetical protein